MEADKENPETGVVLSGGQWQRLALARAFLRGQRDFMILDEPSSGLDAQAEHEIHTALDRYRKGRASLLISHRLGAIRDADLIVVLSDGRVVEQGGHVTLMAPGDPVPRDRVPGLADVPHDRVPPGKVVLLGGNSEVSYDSRAMGFIPVERILGVVVRRLGTTAATG
ncbi:S26 family signal peptidase [Streptosporangium sp. NPDC000396]|uniref:S26 family signal peptidase n=1 Tax=Streptosporangium sp. NPDC000396 TaxID=3366185 RepID=UPI00367E3797